MPILNHSNSEIADKTPFEAFHTQWAAHIVIDLNERLPEGFLAVPHTTIEDVLPELPLLITFDIAVPVNLEKTYMDVCRVFRLL
jgi:hypothetical protein